MVCVGGKWSWGVPRGLPPRDPFVERTRRDFEYIRPPKVSIQPIQPIHHRDTLNSLINRDSTIVRYVYYSESR